jgi:N6-L-threonylcarbamoyladenine synthase
MKIIRRRQGFDFPYVSAGGQWGAHDALSRRRIWALSEFWAAPLDDAAGEAFDKFAKKIGLGFPGGCTCRPAWLRLGNASRSIDFPRAMLKDERDDMSFSGLKTAAARLFDELLDCDRDKDSHSS